MPLDQLMTEILVEELTRYQDINIANDISIFPNNDDLWGSGISVKRKDYN
jgi:hypothetical protein